jgi:hypothetical protein
LLRIEIHFTGSFNRISRPEIVRRLPISFISDLWIRIESETNWIENIYALFVIEGDSYSCFRRSSR